MEAKLIVDMTKKQHLGQLHNEFALPHDLIRFGRFRDCWRHLFKLISSIGLDSVSKCCLKSYMVC